MKEGAAHGVHLRNKANHPGGAIIGVMITLAILFGCHNQECSWVPWPETGPDGPHRLRDLC